MEDFGCAHKHALNFVKYGLTYTVRGRFGGAWISYLIFCYSSSFNLGMADLQSQTREKEKEANR